MKIEGGFWQNFKGAFGIGLGGGLGAGFGWRIGEAIANGFIKLIKWGVILAFAGTPMWMTACDDPGASTLKGMSAEQRAAEVRRVINEAKGQK